MNRLIMRSSGKTLEVIPVDTVKQLSFLDAAPAAPKTNIAAITQTAALNTAINAYLDAQYKAGRSQHTIIAYRTDLGLLAAYAGKDYPIGSFSLDALTAFLQWTQGRPNISCKPKTLERRTAALRAFFAWLTETHTIRRNPAAGLQYQPVPKYLPHLPSAAEMQSILTAARKLADPRPLAIVQLVAATGIKKGELMRLALGDITPQSVSIRYTSPRSLWKSRRLPLPEAVSETLWDYREQTPALDAENLWFPFATKTIETFVAAAGEAAGLSQRLTCETLRWVYAVDAMQAGTDPERLRERLALSPQWWSNTWKTLNALSRLRELPVAQ